MLQNVDTIASMLVLTGCFGLVLGQQYDDKIQIHIFNYYHYRAATFGGVKGSWLDQQLLAADERECAPTERKSN